MNRAERRRIEKKKESADKSITIKVSQVQQAAEIIAKETVWKVLRSNLQENNYNIQTLSDECLLVALKETYHFGKRRIKRLLDCRQKHLNQLNDAIMAHNTGNSIKLQDWCFGHDVDIQKFFGIKCRYIPKETPEDEELIIYADEVDYNE